MGATVLAGLLAVASPDAPPIDRKALVGRHHPVLRRLDAESPLSVGNGELTFTTDVTGLQTFPEEYEQTIPLATLAQWGWHIAPNPSGWSIDRFPFQEFESHGRRVGYADIPGDVRTPEIEWLRANPHRLHLGRIGFLLTRSDGARARPEDLGGIEQTLDLWEGVLKSRFQVEGQPVEVETVCHPVLDLLAVRVVSPLVRLGRLAIEFRFPYGTGDASAADWTRPEAHETRILRRRPGSAELLRRLDENSYSVALAWGGQATLHEEGRHHLLLRPSGSTNGFEATIRFARSGVPMGPHFAATHAASRDAWRNFWTSGAAVDLSGSLDRRWRELERRIVLSQYLTAIQGAGSLPPAETGLTFNSWEGKFHLEMHWWHAAHFALWGRLERLEKSLGYYSRILPRARATAARQSYAGARWPKMTDPSGAESPSSIGPFLVWQQPHPIFYAELVYRQRPSRATLQKYTEVVEETAAFLASFPAEDLENDRLVLGPPLQCAQEVFPKDRTINCSFELAYWRWGLETAQTWRERSGQKRVPARDRVLKRLSPLGVVDGKYLFAESAPDSYQDPRWARDHPSVTAALGVLPGRGVDPETMRRTLDWIWTHWSWPDTWGWDYPMVAMTAARLGEPQRAVDALLLDTPKNRYRANGHNHQRPGLTIYLPGNGGLLYAVALMAAGWDGGPTKHAPGFPDDGQWSVRWEGLHRAP